MASTGKVGRNDPCTCGSGKKYKLCCARKEGTLSPIAWIAIVGVAAAAMAALVLSFTTTTSVSATTCPPGQVWAMDHGHCH
jgi:hypothetical protein